MTVTPIAATLPLWSQYTKAVEDTLGIRVDTELQGLDPKDPKTFVGTLAFDGKPRNNVQNGANYTWRHSYLAVLVDEIVPAGFPGIAATYHKNSITILSGSLYDWDAAIAASPHSHKLCQQVVEQVDQLLTRMGLA